MPDRDRPYPVQPPQARGPQKLRGLFVACILLALAALPGAAETTSELPRIVARVGTQTVTAEQLEAMAGPELGQMAQQRYLVLERSLLRLIDEQLLEAEARLRGITREQLMATEVEANVAPVTDAEVDAWFTANQERIRQPKEQVAERIRELLASARLQERRGELLAELAARHPVVSYLEPHRLDIDTAGAPRKGPANAPVTIVEFSDFQCPACQRMNPNLVRLRETYGDRVAVVFRQFPLSSIHAQAAKAAEASLCAEEQGKFWEMHDALFAGQHQLSGEDLKTRAAALELDTERFDQCLDDGRFRAAVQSDLAAGQRLGVTGTPTLFINGRPVQLLSGTPLYDQLARYVDDELARAQQPAPAR